MLPTACLKSQLGCCGGSDPCSVTMPSHQTVATGEPLGWGLLLVMRFRPATNIPLVSVNLSCLGKTRKQMHGKFGKWERTYNCISIVHVKGSVFVRHFQKIYRLILFVGTEGWPLSPFLLSTPAYLRRAGLSELAAILCS